jgi:hypothetical protein
MYFAHPRESLRLREGGAQLGDSIMDMDERNRALAERRKAMMEGDFKPGYTPESVPPPEARLATATEYAAYQLGQINRKLDRLIATADRLSGSQPDPRPFSQIKAEREAKR